MDSVSVLVPRFTPVAAEDEPERDAIVAPDVVPEMSSTPEPLAVTPDMDAIDPLPDRAKVALLIVIDPE